jgi:hypothetical protein
VSIPPSFCHGMLASPNPTVPFLCPRHPTHPHPHPYPLQYTLAQYKPETFETLAHEQTVEKLVHYFGYPTKLYDLTFDWQYMARGLVIDKRRGNMLKIDRHKYVKMAHHGFKELSRESRMETYNNTGEQVGRGGGREVGLYPCCWK